MAPLSKWSDKVCPAGTLLSQLLALTALLARPAQAAPRIPEISVDAGPRFEIAVWKALDQTPGLGGALRVDPVWRINRWVALGAQVAFVGLAHPPIGLSGSRADYQLNLGPALELTPHPRVHFALAPMLGVVDYDCVNSDGPCGGIGVQFIGESWLAVDVARFPGHGAIYLALIGLGHYDGTWLNGAELALGFRYNRY